jgi:uncharacterized protein (DUF2141 family)
MTLSKLLPAIAGFAVFLLSATSVLAADLTVAVSGLRNQTGQVLVALHDAKASFPNNWSRAVSVKRVVAQDGTGVRFENLPAGRYAVIAVHDEDGNGEMTKTFIGRSKGSAPANGAICCHPFPMSRQPFASTKTRWRMG